MRSPPRRLVCAKAAPRQGSGRARGQGEAEEERERRQGLMSEDHIISFQQKRAEARVVEEAVIADMSRGDKSGAWPRWMVEAAAVDRGDQSLPLGKGLIQLVDEARILLRNGPAAINHRNSSRPSSLQSKSTDGRRKTG